MQKESRTEDCGTHAGIQVPVNDFCILNAILEVSTAADRGDEKRSSKATTKVLKTE